MFLSLEKTPESLRPHHISWIVGNMVKNETHPLDLVCSSSLCKCRGLNYHIERLVFCLHFIVPATRRSIRMFHEAR